MEDHAVPTPEPTPSAPRVQVADVVLHTTTWCGYCHRAKALLETHGIVYEEIVGDGSRAHRLELLEIAGGTSVPQVLIGGRAIGGSSELAELARRGELDELVWGTAGGAGDAPG